MTDAKMLPIAMKTGATDVKIFVIVKMSRVFATMGVAKDAME